jgi:hypothetical protein
MSLDPVNKPKYATQMNGGRCVLGTGASTVGATAINVDGIAADAKICYTPGVNGGIIESVTISTTDTAAVTAILYLLEVATSEVHHLGVVAVPANSGNLSTAPAVDALNASLGLGSLPINYVFRRYIPIRAGFVLKVASKDAMTANKILICKTTGVDLVA